MKLVGISGEAGSGKDTVAAFLRDTFGLVTSVSLGDLVRAQLSEIGVVPNRALQRMVADYRRTTRGSNYWVDLAISHTPREKEFLLLTGIYAPGEAQHLLRLGGVLVWLEALEPTRIQRIKERRDGPRDELLLLNPTAFISQLQDEKGSQILDSESAASLSAVKSFAQYVIQNDGDLDALKKSVDNFTQFLEQTFRRPPGNLSLIAAPVNETYEAAAPWMEDLDSLIRLEKSKFFQNFLAGPEAAVLGAKVEVVADMLLGEAVRVLYKPNLLSITGTQTAKRVADIIEVESPRTALINLRAFKPSNQEEEYFIGLTDHVFHELHMKAHVFWLNNKDTILKNLDERLKQISKIDAIQFGGKRYRGLEKVRDSGVAFSIPENEVAAIVELAQNPILKIKPILEIIKNDRIFEVSGFKNSKASIVVHDVVDHLWTFELLDRIGLLSKYKEMFDAIGNPEKIDIFKREGEIVASIAFGVRAFQGVAPGFRPIIGSKDIVRMVRDLRGRLSDRHTDALRIVNNLDSDGTEWRSLGYTYSNYLTELDEQRRVFGCIKFRDPKTRRVVSELDPQSPDYLCFFIEVHHALLDSANKHRNALFYTHFIIEEYLRGIGSEGTTTKPIAITASLLDGAKLRHSNSVPKEVSEWMFRNYGFTANRNLV